MPYKEVKDEDLKTYWTIGEVAEELGIFTSTLRFWDTEFPWIRTKYDRKGHRQYDQRSKRHVTDIHYLLHVCGMTIVGVHKAYEGKYMNKLLKFFEGYNGLL